MQAALVLVRPDGSTHEIPIKRPHVLIGRQESCSLRINSSSVSRQHCEIFADDARLTIKDLGSSNGTYVNRRRISQADLAAGDLIAVGSFVFVVRVDGNPASVDGNAALKNGAVSPAGPSPSSAGHAVGTAGKNAAKPVAVPKKPSSEGTPGDDPDADSSSEWDFDFLDNKDDEAPKL